MVRRPGALGICLALLFALLCAPLLTAPAQAALTGDEQNTISIYERTHAGVVNITSQAVAYNFFMQPIPKEATGSGSIIDTDGHILTNFHVIKDARRLEVSLADGSRFPAQVVGVDPLTDLALIKIDAPAALLTPIPLGDSTDLKIGQKVLAIGNPFGLEQSLTTGVISSIRQLLRTGNVEIEGVVQTDAAINPGNSGGPLLDSSGQQIGVNTAIFTPSGGNIGIGFAVPINTAKLVVNDLLTYGYVVQGYLGAGLQTVTPQLARALGLPVARGAQLTDLLDKGPADAAGLKGGKKERYMGNVQVSVGGDIVIEADGQTIDNHEQLSQMIRRRRPGTVIKLRVIRNGKPKDIEVTLGERPRRDDGVENAPIVPIRP